MPKVTLRLDSGRSTTISCLSQPEEPAMGDLRVLLGLTTPSPRDSAVSQKWACPSTFRAWM